MRVFLYVFLRDNTTEKKAKKRRERRTKRLVFFEFFFSSSSKKNRHYFLSSLCNLFLLAVKIHERLVALLKYRPVLQRRTF